MITTINKVDMSIYELASVCMYDFVGLTWTTKVDNETYFKLKTFQIQQMQKEPFSELSLSD